jgi:hypothetical protein
MASNRSSAVILLISVVFDISTFGSARLAVRAGDLTTSATGKRAFATAPKLDEMIESTLVGVLGETCLGFLCRTSFLSKPVALAEAAKSSLGILGC